MGDGELLWSAVSEAVAPIAHLETQWDSDKLEKKIRDYFKKAAKGLQYTGKAWDVLINEYADAVFSSIFCGLGDRGWLPQADFLLCVDAGIKDLFPPRLFAGVPQQVFEQTVLHAADRAFDEQRYWTFRWETIQRIVVGKGTQKKVREALDTARQHTVEEDQQKVQDFIASWVVHFVVILNKSTQGDPGSCLPESTAIELFQALVQEGGLPLKLVSEEGIPPPGWPAVGNMVRQAYADHGGEAESTAFAGGKAAGGKAKGKWSPAGAASEVGEEAVLWAQKGAGWTQSGGWAKGGGWANGSEEPAAKRWKGGW